MVKRKLKIIEKDAELTDSNSEHSEDSGEEMDNAEILKTLKKRMPPTRKSTMINIKTMDDIDDHTKEKRINEPWNLVLFEIK